MLSLQKKIICSRFTPRFFIRKLIKVRERFLWGGTHLSEGALREGDTCKTNRKYKQGGQGSIIENFERTIFLNFPLKKNIYYLQISSQVSPIEPGTCILFIHVQVFLLVQNLNFQ